MLKPAIVGRLLAALLALACVADLRGDDPPTQSETKSDWEQRAVQGWNVFVRPELQTSEPAATRRALQLLDQQLAEIVRVVPAAAVAELRKVPLYLSPEYAMTDPMEYFAETTEAFFSRNDFFPFTRDELQSHDPKMVTLLKKLWGTPE
jgi:hypothetical protein